MVMPQRFKVLNSEQHVGFGVDTWCHPDYRGRFYGLQLNKAFFDAQEGSLALNTTANAISEYIWLMENAISIGDLDKSFLFPYRSAPLVCEVLLRRWPRFPAGSFVASIAGTIRDALLRKSTPTIAASIKVQGTSNFSTCPSCSNISMISTHGVISNISLPFIKLPIANYSFRTFHRTKSAA